MKIKLKIAFIIFVSTLNINCNMNSSKSGEQTGNITLISPTEFKEKSQNNLIVDIRTPQEFRQGRIKNAVNINLFDKSFLEEIEKLDKTKPIFIYCRTGNRTSSASKKMKKLGFSQVYDLKGGIVQWARSNYKIEK